MQVSLSTPNKLQDLGLSPYQHKLGLVKQVGHSNASYLLSIKVTVSTVPPHSEKNNSNNHKHDIFPHSFWEALSFSFLSYPS